MKWRQHAWASLFVLLACGPSTGALSPTAPAPGAPPTMPRDRTAAPPIEVLTDPSVLNRRWQPLSGGVEIGWPGGLMLNGSESSSVALTQLGALSAPTVDGVALVATSIHTTSTYAVVSYAELGPDRTGSVDILDVSNPASPTLVSQLVLHDADVNGAVVEGTSLYLALASSTLGLAETAAIRRLGFSAGMVDLGTDVLRGLSGRVATSVLANGGQVYATSATDGGVFVLDPTDLSIQASILTTDARSVDVDSGRVAVHGGNEIYIYDVATLANPLSHALPSSAAAEAKAGIILTGGKVYASASGNGVHVLSSVTGTQLQTLGPPSASLLGVDGSDIQANAIASSGAYMFMAYGAAGAVVTRGTNDLGTGTSEVSDPLNYWGRLLLGTFASINDVALSGTVLGLAGGLQGTVFLRLTPVGANLDITASAGLNQVFDLSEDNPSGSVWADYDRDGYLDVVVTGSSGVEHFRNNGAGGFVDLMHGGAQDEYGGAVIDGNADGIVDVYTIRGGGGGHFRENDGTGTLAEDSVMDYSTGVAGASSGLVIDDVDNDGLEDVIIFGAILNHVSINQGVSTPADFVTVASGSTGLNGAGDAISNAVASSSDVNEDGYLDIFTTANNGRLFLSDGDGTFTMDLRGMTTMVISSADEASGSFADYDNDGDVDLFVTNRDSGVRSWLWRNDGSMFTDVTVAAGLTNTTRHKGSCWGDYDNDGDLDLYIAVDSNSSSEPSIFYENQGNGTFSLVSDALTTQGRNETCVFVDIDNDGDLDLFVTSEDVEPVLFRNDTNFPNYIMVRALGKGPGGSSRIGQGVRIELYQADGTTFLARRELGVQTGGSSEPLRAHFGNVDPATTYVVKTYFRSGVVNTTVTPGSVSTTIGSTTIPKLLTVNEP